MYHKISNKEKLKASTLTIIRSYPSMETKDMEVQKSFQYHQP